MIVAEKNGEEGGRKGGELLSCLNRQGGERGGRGAVDLTQSPAEQVVVAFAVPAG